MRDRRGCSPEIMDTGQGKKTPSCAVFVSLCSFLFPREVAGSICTEVFLMTFCRCSGRYPRNKQPTPLKCIRVFVSCCWRH